MINNKTSRICGLIKDLLGVEVKTFEAADRDLYLSIDILVPSRSHQGVIDAAIELVENSKIYKTKVNDLETTIATLKKKLENSKDYETHYNLEYTMKHGER